MRPCLRFALALALTTTFAACARAQDQDSDDELRIYAVNVVKTTPFEQPSSGYGIYLGNGGVITAAHVIGRWGILKNPRVQIAGLDLPARIVREGSVDAVDLTLLSIDEASLPIGLRLRRNPLCKQPPKPGESVIGIIPNDAVRSHILSPLAIAPPLRARFSTLTTEVATASGSGIFDARKRCLKGIMSRRIQKFAYHETAAGLVAERTGYAGYFVPASEIAKFVPEEFRF